MFPIFTHVKTVLIKNATIVNEGESFEGDLLVEGGYIAKIGKDISVKNPTIVLEAKGKWLLPGMIDSQVHFRQPGQMTKGNIYCESKAAVAGGVTSFMDMPDTVPHTTTLDLLEIKYAMAQVTSLANFSFYLAAEGNNLEEIKKADPATICGLWLPLGYPDLSGNLAASLKHSPLMNVVNSDDVGGAAGKSEELKERYGYEMPQHMHAEIYSDNASLQLVSHAMKLADLAEKPLHLIGLSSAKEAAILNRGSVPFKTITSGTTISHLFLNEQSYETIGAKIKANPPIRKESERKALLAAIKDQRLDTLSSNHAPHKMAEKETNYWDCPSGFPSIQQALPMLLELHHSGDLSIHQIVQKTSHNPARLFKVKQRGFIREGYFADLVLIDPNGENQVDEQRLASKCAWSPFSGMTFQSKVTHTMVNGNLVYRDGQFDECVNGQRLLFDH